MIAHYEATRLARRGGRLRWPFHIHIATQRKILVRTAGLAALAGSMWRRRIVAAKEVRPDLTIAGNIEHKEIAACTYDHAQKRSASAL